LNAADLLRRAAADRHAEPPLQRSTRNRQVVDKLLNIDWFRGMVADKADSRVDGGRIAGPFDGLLYHHNDLTKMNAMYFDGHVESVYYKYCYQAFATTLTWPDPYSH
jgi:prepilin-type processing-associated H-X9-DG protein